MDSSKKYGYVYDEYYDYFLCLNNQILRYSTTNRDGYREYKSDPIICRDCSMRSRCAESKACQKVVNRLHTAQSTELRKETIELVFGDAKEKHGMRYTQLRCMQKVTMQAALTFACMNLKKPDN